MVGNPIRSCDSRLRLLRHDAVAPRMYEGTGHRFVRLILFHSQPWLLQDVLGIDAIILQRVLGLIALTLPLLHEGVFVNPYLPSPDNYAFEIHSMDFSGRVKCWMSQSG